jgi:GrpB-like predicted nucleotidyltransferase (UPF0157 family)
MKPRRIVVRPYNPIWKLSFLLIRKRLQSVLHIDDKFIHHVGSTAVEGLPAKPIIDIDIEIETIQSFVDTQQKLLLLGYHHIGDQGIKGREVFKLKRWSLLPKHHLYVCVSGSFELKRHLGFRDHLRTHPKTKETYGNIKIEAVKKFPYDMDSYLKIKGELINKVYQALRLD